MKRLDLIGIMFGELVVVKLSRDKGNRGQVKWECICSCGKMHVVTADSLRSGASKSCGCLRVAPKNKTHGMSNSRLYRIYRHMINRCKLPSMQNYHLYGGRGIMVCNEWLEFESFKKWAMTNGYEENLSIDRIENNGNYSPDNCKWSNDYEQARNKRNTKLTNDDVINIRKMRKNGVKNVDIAKAFNISNAHASDVSRSKSWKWMPKNITKSS